MKGGEARGRRGGPNTGVGDRGIGSSKREERGRERERIQRERERVGLQHRRVGQQPAKEKQEARAELAAIRSNENWPYRVRKRATYALMAGKEALKRRATSQQRRLERANPQRLKPFYFLVRKPPRV